MFELTLEQGYPLSTMLAAAAVAIVLAGLFYRRAFGMLRRRQWLLLLSLRIVAILVLILLLFRPVISYQKDLQERPAVIFLVDRSSSMGIADDATGVTRFNQARSKLDQWWPKLDDTFNLHVIDFAERAEVIDSVSALATVAPDGKATSISRALVAAAKRVPRKDVEAVILLSDGNHNAAKNPREIAGKMGTVIHTVGVGASLRSDTSCRDVQLAAVVCPERLLLENKATIQASVEGVGLAGRVIQLVLEDDGSQIAEQEVTLDDAPGPQQCQFGFTPTKKGRHTYTVRAVALAEERIPENNARSNVALVVEPGLRVLYLEGTLRPEYGALVDRFLAKDPDLAFCALVQTRSNVFLKRSNLEGLAVESIPSDAATYKQFDVFILGDLDSSYLPPERQQLIVDRVREGAGLVMLGGYHSLGPGGYAGTPLGEVLPVVLGGRDVGQVTEPFLPVLTPEGARHPIFANIADFFATKTGPAKVEGLPMLDGAARVESLRPGATVLATCPVANDMPVLAVQPLDKGRTAVFVADTTRKWQQGPRAMDQQSPYLRFWGQLVRYLAGRSGEVEAKAGIVGSSDKGYYEPDEPVQLSAIVRDQRGEGTDKATVEATVRSSTVRSETVAMEAVAGQPGHYRGTFDPKTAGSYTIDLDAKLGDDTLSGEKLTVEIGRPNLEFEKLDLDEATLTGIAADSGGRYVHITTADQLIGDLDRTQRKERVYLQQPLSWPPGFWVIFVVALTTEWALRRRFQLR